MPVKFVTETELRTRYEQMPFDVYLLEPGARLTPGARQFLIDFKVAWNDDTCPFGMRHATDHAPLATVVDDSNERSVHDGVNDAEAASVEADVDTADEHEDIVDDIEDSIMACAAQFTCLAALIRDDHPAFAQRCCALSAQLMQIDVAASASGVCSDRPSKERYCRRLPSSDEWAGMGMLVAHVQQVDTYLVRHARYWRRRLVCMQRRCSKESMRVHDWLMAMRALRACLHAGLEQGRDKRGESGA